MGQLPRIAQLVCGLQVSHFGGGSDLFGMRLAAALARAGYPVQIHSIWRFDNPIEQAWAQQLEAAGVTVYYGLAPSGRNNQDLLRALPIIARQLATTQPAILNTHAEPCDLLGVALTRLGLGGRLVRTSHNMREFARSPHLRRATALIYPLVTAAEVGVSQAITTQLNQRPMARRLGRKAHYINNGVDAATVRAQATQSAATLAVVRASYGIPAQAPLIGLIGRLREQKGIPYLLLAMSLLNQQAPNAHCLIIGHGEDAAWLQALANSYGLSKRVHWLGPRSDALALLAGLEVCVSASLWEGLPTVILEAMALGVPVIATAIDGSRDLVLHGQTGLLVPPRDPVALARAITQLLADPDLCTRLTSAAAEHASQFSLSAAARQYQQLYQTLLTATPPSHHQNW